MSSHDTSLTTEKDTLMNLTIEASIVMCTEERKTERKRKIIETDEINYRRRRRNQNQFYKQIGKSNQRKWNKKKGLGIGWQFSGLYPKKKKETNIHIEIEKMMESKKI